ncbi:MAG: aldose epimerase [Opitutales bacterium]|nr:aldose epimerase [Opitutales bacterium]
MAQQNLQYKDGTPIQEWKVGGSTFTACMQKGAQLMSWELNVAGTTRKIIHWPQDGDLQNLKSIRGGNPILFPFAGRCHIDGKKGVWKDPEGNIHEYPTHGFARTGDFEIVEITDKSVTAKLLPDDAAKNVYPYNYTFLVKYSFEELSMTVELTLVNHDSRRIPWAPGHHFYFTLPWHKGLSRKDYILQTDAKKFFNHAANGDLVKAQQPARQPYSFDDPAIVDLIYAKLKSNKITFGPRNSEENIIITHGENPVPNPWSTLVTWTETDDAPYYCVEPWLGSPNCAEHGNGLHFVEAGESQTFKVTVTLA